MGACAVLHAHPMLVPYRSYRHPRPGRDRGPRDARTVLWRFRPMVRAELLYSPFSALTRAQVLDHRAVQPTAAHARVSVAIRVRWHQCRLVLAHLAQAARQPRCERLELASASCSRQNLGSDDRTNQPPGAGH